jgi:hypothetical protein
MQPANLRVRGARIVLVAGQQCRLRLVLQQGTRLVIRPRGRMQERGVQTLCIAGRDGSR